MTNAQIIFNNSIELLNNGIIKGTGKYMTMKLDDGTEKQQEIPEEIHTYAAWKQLGFQVKKGSKAVASFTIWKYAEKTAKDDNGQIALDENGDEISTSSMFMKKASFFTVNQVEKIA